MTGDRLYLCPHPGCTFRHTCLVTLAEHKREHVVKPDPQTRAEMREYIERSEPGLLKSLGMDEEEDE